MEARGGDGPIRETWLRACLAILGVTQLGVGAWEAISPHTFFGFAAFGAENDHFIRDLSTLYLALGLALLVTAYRPSWRIPVLAFATAQYTFHLVNHVVDVGHGHPGWVGPVNAAGVALGAAVFGAMLWATWRKPG